MKATFNQIEELLEDPFFEVRYLGKDAILQRTLSLDKYGEISDNFQFVDWSKNDNQEIIEYSIEDTMIGRVLVANTSKGICFLGFVVGDGNEIKEDFIRRFPKNRFRECSTYYQKLAVQFCNGNHKIAIPLHMRGTSFQISIWKKLVRIPIGRLSAYGSLAPNAGGAQAIGSAVGANPVSYIVPCHRVVKQDGNYQGYHWGAELKKQLLAYEFITSRI